MKKVLMIATVPSMIGQFNMNNIKILKEMGYAVDVACDWTENNVWSEEKKKELKDKLKRLNIKFYQISYSRSIFDINKHIKAYRQTLALVKENKYEFMHCHTPIASAISRIVCKKTHTRCIYTAHGFHFFKGASIKNWIIFYPIEKWLSKYTDILITINQEDYDRAKRKFNMKKLEYVPGVGIDIKNFNTNTMMREKKRESFGIKENEILMLSIGELSKRKNHELVVKALNNLKNINGFERINYFICGSGELLGYLKDLVKKFDLENTVHFLGFRTDISEICQAADLFVFPSLQEGLPVALMESIACNLGCVCSNIRGNIDLVKNKEFVFDPLKVDELTKILNQLLINQEGNIDIDVLIESMKLNKQNNYMNLANFDLSIVENKMKEIYKLDK